MDLPPVTTPDGFYDWFLGGLLALVAVVGGYFVALYFGLVPWIF